MNRPFDIYRNLRTGGYSVKDRATGKVIDRPHHIVAHDVEFVVLKGGQARARREGRRNVHAFVRCAAFSSPSSPLPRARRIRYNPFTMDEFTPEVGVLPVDRDGRSRIGSVELSPDGLYEVA